LEFLTEVIIVEGFEFCAGIPAGFHLLYDIFVVVAGAENIRLTLIVDV